jgi:hypothetical protein
MKKVRGNEGSTLVDNEYGMIKNAKLEKVKNSTKKF